MGISRGRAPHWIVTQSLLVIFIALFAAACCSPMASLIVTDQEMSKGADDMLAKYDGMLGMLSFIGGSKKLLKRAIIDRIPRPGGSASLIDAARGLTQLSADGVSTACMVMFISLFVL